VQYTQALNLARSAAGRDLISAAAVLAAIFIAYVPTYVTLAEGPWQSEQEGHGPLIILGAAWIAWQCRAKLAGVAILPAPVAGWAILLGGLVLMVVTRSQDVLMLEVFSEIPVIAGAIVLLAGWGALRVFAFPLAFLIFSVPPPGWLLDTVTVPLKVFVSDVVTHVLYMAGYPIAQNGVVIMVGPYQLLVQDACSGMNSIFALSAIGFFYVYLLPRGSIIRKVLVLASILPITVAANIARVMALVLIAYYAGIGTIEGPLHELTGIALFVIALVMLLLFDGLLVACGAVVRWLRPRFASLVGASTGNAT
jgi:exosortase B